MKAFNIVHFVGEVAIELNDYRNAIKEAKTYEEAKGASDQMLGYIDCVSTFVNNMTTEENIGFVEDFRKDIDAWLSVRYHTLADKISEIF